MLQKIIQLNLFIFLLLGIFLTCNDKAQAATSVTQYGITWTFDADYTVGQFVNGDYYVVDPGSGVNIVNINPGDAIRPSTTQHMNGSMINPSSATQGYDGFGYDGAGGLYSDSVNVGIGISGSTPIILYGDSSLVSTISNLAPEGTSHGSYVKTAAVITCLAVAPPVGIFRPGISGSIKTLYNQGDLNMSLLKKLAVPVGQTVTADTLTTYAQHFKMVWPDHNGGWTARLMHPSDSGMHNYYYAPTVAQAALLLQLNFTDAEKRELLINFIEFGIDHYSFIAAGANGWPPDGGHSNGRKWPILFAGLMLNDEQMKNVGQKSGDYLYFNGHGPGNHPSDLINFGEDGQTFYVAQSDVDITNGPTWNPDIRTAPNFPYSTAMLGMPEWGIVYSAYQNKSDSSWGAIYRTIGSAMPSWAGFAMSAYFMDAKTLWNHNAFFDYVDRYMAIAKGDPDPFGYVVDRQGAGARPGGLVGAMYDTYRNDYNSVDIIPPNIPTGLGVL